MLTVDEVSVLVGILAARHSTPELEPELRRLEDKYEHLLWERLQPSGDGGGDGILLVDRAVRAARGVLGEDGPLGARPADDPQLAEARSLLRAVAAAPPRRLASAG